MPFPFAEGTVENAGLCYDATELVRAAGGGASPDEMTLRGFARKIMDEEIKDPGHCSYDERDGGTCTVAFAAAGVSCNDGDDGTVSDICDGHGGCSGTQTTTTSPTTSATTALCESVWSGEWSCNAEINGLVVSADTRYAA